MRLAESLIEELEREAKSTVRMLERVPTDRFDWKPHEKSMSVGQLAWHVATLPLNGVLGLKSKVKEVGGVGPRPSPQGGQDLVATLNDSVAQLKAALQATPDETLIKERFSFVRNGQPVVSFPMIGLIRTVVLNHSVHHRGQLSVYLRLMNIPVPAMYGTSADESVFD
ncbi:MAG: damage-inducible protein DinB [Acidobacteria bacterium]|nr:MAG: damage-inducible protein DinB [Acidobacteriota bacterium]